jgi:hypothetical protein
MVMVISDMDPHIISWNLGWVWFGFVELGFTRLWVGHGETP